MGFTEPFASTQSIKAFGFIIKEFQNLASYASNHRTLVTPQIDVDRNRADYA